MQANPYEPPETHGSALETAVPAYRVQSLVLLMIALVVAVRQLPPLFARPVLSWQWDEWLLALIPSAYLLAAAVYSLLTEFNPNRFLVSRISLVLLPLVGLTVLILLATAGYIWNAGIGFLADWRAIAILAICPFGWWYFILSVRRWRSICCRQTQR